MEFSFADGQRTRLFYYQPLHGNRFMATHQAVSEKVGNDKRKQKVKNEILVKDATNEIGKVKERQLNHNGLESNTVSAGTFSPPDFVQRELQQIKRIQKILCPYLGQP